MNNGMFGLPPGLPPVSGLGLGQGVGPTFIYQKVKAYCKPGTYAAERVPDRVKTALVMVFGGGGDGWAGSSSSAYSGAGGGFAMAEFPVTPGELLPPIIVGNRAGTSSFGQFLSATGGSHANSGAHGTGGTGVTMPGLKNALAYPGGSPTGGIGSLIQGGGSSGSPYGPGVGPGTNQSGGGGWGQSPTDNNILGGNGLYKNVNLSYYGVGGAGSAASNTGNYGEDGGIGVTEQVNYGLTPVTYNPDDYYFKAQGSVAKQDLLLIPYLQLFGGAGGGGIQWSRQLANSSGSILLAGDGGPGGGGGGIFIDTATSYASHFQAGNGGLGGGGGGIWNYSGVQSRAAIGGRGGFGGGGGGVMPGSSNTTHVQMGGDGGIGGGGAGTAYVQSNGLSRAGKGGTGAVLIYYIEGN